MLALLAALALLVVACGSNEDGEGGAESGSAQDAPGAAETEAEQPEGEGAEEPAGEPEVTDVLVGILPTLGYAPVVLADEQGFFEEEGLNVETTVPAPGSAVSGIVGGTYHFAGINWIAYVLSVNSGVELHPVSELERGVPEYAQLLVTGDSEVQSLADLAGQDVAVVSAPGNCDVIQVDAMQQEGVDEAPSFVTLAIPDMPGALERGDIAAACVPQPLLGDLLDSGDFRPVLDLFVDEYEGFPISGMATSRQFADANPNTVAAFTRALQRAAELAIEGDQAIRDVLPVYTNFTPDQASAVVLPEYASELDAGRLELTTDIMNRVGMFEQELEAPGS